MRTFQYLQRRKEGNFKRYEKREQVSVSKEEKKEILSAKDQNVEFFNFLNNE